MMFRKLALFLYYAVGQHLPTQPFPGWRFGYSLRRLLLKFILKEAGKDLIVKQRCYFGSGNSLAVGDRSQLGHNSRIGPQVTIGDDVVMGPDVVIMTTRHAFDDPNTPIRLQGALSVLPVKIGNDVWLGTRVVILPGVNIGDGAVIGAGSIVTRDIPPLVVAVGNPARVIRSRGLSSVDAEDK